MSAARDSGLTRKQRREQARLERKAREAAARARAERRKRLIQLGSVVGVVLAVIAGIAIGTSQSTKTGIARGNDAAKTVANVSSLLNGIPQADALLGDPNAPVTLEYFGDLECSFCRQFTLNVLPSLIEKYVRPGKLKIEYHSFETASAQGPFQEQQVAALAAGRQNLMWYFLELFYHEQGQEGTGYVTETYLDDLARQVPGLNLSKWHADRGEKALAEQVIKDGQVHEQAGLENTPSFLLGKTGSVLKVYQITSTTDPGEFESAIEDEIE